MEQAVRSKNNQPGLRLLNVSQYTSLTQGGAERYIHEVNSRLNKAGWSVHSLASDNYTLAEPFKLLSAGVHPFWFKQAAKALEAIKPDIVLAHLTVPALTDIVVAEAHKRGIPVLLIYHSDVTGPSRLSQWLGEAYNRCVGQATLAKAKHVVVSSRAYHQRSPLLRRYQGKWSTVTPGVAADLSKVSPSSSSKPPYFLFVGKPDESAKGFDTLYPAWRDIYQKLGIELWVVGSSRRAKSDGVRYMGYVSDLKELRALYANAYATVLPSRVAESFGMVLAESLVCGTPIVATDVGGIPAVVEHGKNGYLVKADSQQSLRSALFDVIAHRLVLREYIQQQNYASQFSWDATADHIDKLLLQLISR